MSKLSLIRRVLPASVTVKAGRAALQISHQSPHILFGAGLVGFVSTTVLASRATLRVEEVLHKTQSDLGNVRMVAEGPLAEKHGYSDEDATKDRIYIYSRAFVDLTKLYGPALITGALTVFCLTKSHQILTTRNSALTAAYVSLDRAYQAYRRRVADEFGPEREREIAYTERVVEVSTSSDDIQRKIANAEFSPYAKFFDESSTQWQKNAELNYVFLRAQQNYSNDLLRSRGYLFLNEVYGNLGLEHTAAGAVVGWILSDEGDNYVDFGFLDGERERSRSFVNHMEHSVLLDFNVDGVIFDKLPKRRGR